TLDNLRLSERYLVGKVEFLAHLRFRATGPGKQHNLITVVRHQEHRAGRYHRRWYSRAELLHNLAESGVVVEDWVAVTEPELLDAVGGDEQEAVLVEVVNIVKCPEYLKPRLVRLFRPDKVYRRRTHALYFSRERGFITGWCLIEWEVGIAV